MKLKVSKIEQYGIHNYKKEVKVRNEQICCNCFSIIKKGDIALVHHVHSGVSVSREYYCNNCYWIED